MLGKTDPQVGSLGKMKRGFSLIYRLPDLNVMLYMKQVSYYSKKLLFAVFVVTMFYAILFQKGTLEIYLAQNDGVKLPVLSQLFLEIMPNSHISVSVAGWLLFFLGFLLYNKDSKLTDGWLVSFGLIVIYIWSTISVSMSSRVLLTSPSENHGLIGNVLWVLIPSIFIIRICCTRYRKNNSFKAIFA